MGRHYSGFTREGTKKAKQDARLISLVRYRWAVHDRDFLAEAQVLNDG